MIEHFLKTSWRNLVRNKAFSTINMLGLALGLASSLLIFLWVKDERSMDNFHANAPHIYDVYERVFSEGKLETSTITPGPLANELKRSIPEIRYASGFDRQDQQALFEAGDKIISMVGNYADSDFFKIFSYPLLEGRPGSALNNSYDIAISKKM